MIKKLFIFDLDGVLIDSIRNMRFALKETCKKLNIKIPFNDYEKNIGLPFEVIMKNLGFESNTLQIKKKYEFFSKKNILKIKISKKKIDIINKLKKDYYIAIFTSKSKKRTNLIIKNLKIFDFIVTADDVSMGKPNPEGINKILKNFKVKKKDTFYLGDSSYDYNACKSAKIKYFHAKWGYGKDLEKNKKIKIIKNFDDLLKI